MVTSSSSAPSVPTGPPQRVLVVEDLEDTRASLQELLQGRHAFRNVLSKSPRMHDVFELVGQIADTTSTVLIRGETGTGKEEVARAIHQASSPIRPGPFVPVNCGA